MRLNHSSTNQWKSPRWSWTPARQRTFLFPGALVFLFMALLMTTLASSRPQKHMPQISRPVERTLAEGHDFSKQKPSAFVQTTQEQSDDDLSRQLRNYLATEKSLSSYARAVRVTTRNGRISVKGSVRSESEKRTIEAKAMKIAGPSNVITKLNIKGPQDAIHE